MERKRKQFVDQNKHLEDVWYYIWDGRRLENDGFSGYRRSMSNVYLLAKLPMLPEFDDSECSTIEYGLDFKENMASKNWDDYWNRYRNEYGSTDSKPAEPNRI